MFKRSNQWWLESHAVQTWNISPRGWYKIGISALRAISRDQTDVVEACHLKACKGGPEEEG